MLRPSLEKAVVLCALLAACSSSNGSTDAGSADTGPVMTMDAGMDAGPAPTCVSNPQTYADFLNGCTTVKPVPTVQYRLPMQYPDGGVPPPDTYALDGGLPMDMCDDAGTVSDAGSGS